ncbi:MAG: hypothetical protein IKC71_00775 [Clostridia bacterium]|nr:hypothetical protein [Clostridia bacterium]
MLFFYYKKVVVKNIFNILENNLNSYAVISVNSAVLEVFSIDNGYESIVNIEKNKDNDVVLIELNAIKTNQINREISNIAKEIFVSQVENGIPIPLGSFLGLEIFSAYGKKINLKVLNEVFVVCDFNSSFTSAGINQTRHSIYLEVYLTSKIELPFTKREIVSKTEVLLCEAVIVGKIPNTILGI